MYALAEWSSGVSPPITEDTGAMGREIYIITPGHGVVAYMVKKLVDVDDVDVDVYVDDVDVDVDDVDVYVYVDDVDIDMDVDVDGAKKPFQVFCPRCTKFCEQHDFQ
jgi:hypothetical protein